MDQLIFKKRRKEFLKRITVMGGGLVILAAGTEQERNPEVNHEFRQESNFYYLTGLEQPDAIAAFVAHEKTPDSEPRGVRSRHAPNVVRGYTLFVHPRDPKKELWLGPNIGPEEAMKQYEADQAFPISDLRLKISDLFSGATTIWPHTHSRKDIGDMIHDTIGNLRYKQRSGVTAPDTIRDPLPVIADMRLRKSATEIAAIQKAIDITAGGFTNCFTAVKPGMREYQLRAILEHAFRRKGAVRHGYAPIVASGAGTCILHNPHDRTTIKKNSLVLIDAGAEWNYYSADITRTFPASGQFTKEQRTVYDVVLEAQLRAIAMIKPGARLNDIEEKTRDFITKALAKKKIVSNPPHPNPLPKGRGYASEAPTASSLYFPHRLSHWLGMDVHDVGRYDIPLEPGMVLTIEPGVYLKKSKEINPDYWGIGIRIEDDILVTKHGNKNLSQRIPKDPTVLEWILRH